MMDRLDELRKHVRHGAKGIEIAPYFNPIAPKSLGYDTLIVDVFDTERLLKNASEDPNVPPNRISEIEEVDIVSDASRLGDAVAALGLAGKIDFIVSSHNFEHLPNPIGFLQGCSTALRDGGVLTMAIPDYRYCFDHFRAPTRLADWLQAYHENRAQPSPATIFDFQAGHSREDLGEGPMNYVPVFDLQEAYKRYLALLKEAGEYQDAHCSTLFGDLFTLLMMDLRHLRLTDLKVMNVVEPGSFEFYVHLTKASSNAASDCGDDYISTRLKVLRRSTQA